MAGGKKAADPTKATPADSLAETPAEPKETTRDTTTLSLLQARALKVDAVSTRLDEHDNNKHKEQRDIPSGDDEVGEGGKEPEYDVRTAAATGGARDAAAVFIDPRDWEDLLPRALTYLRRFKAKKALTPEEQVAERLIYSRVFDTAEHERSANVVDGLLAALDDKRLEVGLAAAAKAHASATFKRQAAERDTDHDKARMEKGGVGGTGETSARARKQVTSWIRDGVRVPFRYNRPPLRFNQGVSFNDATPAQLKFLTAELGRFTAAGAWEKSSCAWWVSRAFFVPKPGDNQWRFIIDLRVLNTFCARKRLRMETLMGVRHLTAKGDYMCSFDLQDGFYAMGIDYFMRGARILPYVDDFLLFASSESEALELRQRVADLLDSLGLLRNPAKGLWEPVHARPATPVGYVPVRELQLLAGRAQYLYLAIPAARFYLRELHDVVGSKWGGRVRMTHQLRRDLQWWTAVPAHANGRPIHRSVETAYTHCDSSGYGWGAVLNGRLDARGFWGVADERQHITWKELKAVRLAVESFVPHLAGRRVLLHEDNLAVCNVLAGLTSRSPAMMAELRKLWYLLDSNGVHIRACYIRSAGNVWADRLSRHLDSDDWQLDHVLFAELEAMWVQKLRQSGAAATIVAPRWEGKVWHHVLTEMAVAERVVLPRRDLFGRGGGQGAICPERRAGQ
eukprot:jgi/Tetstr1/440101/TSEL_028459.t1